MSLELCKVGVGKPMVSFKATGNPAPLECNSTWTSLLPPLFTHDHTQFWKLNPYPKSSRTDNTKGWGATKQTSTSVTEMARRITESNFRIEPSNLQLSSVGTSLMC